MTATGDGFDALVYNTTGCGPCPDEEFAAIDVEALAAEQGCDLVWRNPRRFWMMDALTVDLVGEPATFGGVPFNLGARMRMPAGFDPGGDQSAFAYRRTQIHRVNEYQYLAITTPGVADIVPDGLADMYQGLVGGVGSCDPREPGLA